jgi:pimeloyl-ACP methyl ester carboxylesterase
MEDRISDIQAVMDAVGLDQAVLLGSSEGAAACAYFAALYPKRVSALIFYSPAVVVVADDECPWAWTPKFWARFFEALAWYARYFRLSASPALVRTLMRHNREADIRDVLPTIRVPTLVLHPADETWISVESGRYAARKIPGARLVELPGTDHYIWEQNAPTPWPRKSRSF